MIPRASRLDRTAFEPLIKRGKLVRSSHVTLRFLNSGRDEVAKCSVVVSAKAVPRAVDRNRVKRQIRSVFEPRLASLPRGLQCAVFVQKSADQCSFIEIETEILSLLKNV